MVSRFYTKMTLWRPTRGRRGVGVLTRCRRRSASARWASSCCLHCAAAALASRRAPASLWLLSWSAKNSASHWTSPTELRGRRGARGVRGQSGWHLVQGLLGWEQGQNNTKLGSGAHGTWSRELWLMS